MRISDWSSDVCSSDLRGRGDQQRLVRVQRPERPLARYELAQREAAGARALEQARLVVAVEQEHRVGRLREPQLRQFGVCVGVRHLDAVRSEEHTSELQSLMRISYAGFCLKKKK